MKLFRLLACGAFFFSTLVPAQIAPVGKRALVRIERQQDASESRCMLVYDDASFRAEHMHSSKTDVIEGSLDAGRFSQISDMVKSKDFASIQHEHLSTTMLAHNPDIVSVDVLRDDGTQQLRFANRDDRKAYSAQVDPVLKWFDGAQKVTGTKADSAIANRCLPAESETARRVATVAPGQSPTAPSTEPSNPYHIANLLLLFTQEKYESGEPIQLIYTPAEDTSKFGSVTGTKDCLLVRQDGAAYFARIKMAASVKQQLLEMHLTLSADQLTDLKRAMDEPVLANSKELWLNAPPGLAKEVERAEVVAVRSGGTQRLIFRAASGITNLNSTFRGDETTGGRGNDGSKETAPLRSWVKKNINAKQLEAVKKLSGECP
jgi:hypothetical protein